MLENLSPAHLRGDVICDFATLFSAIRSGSGKSGSIGLGPLFLGGRQGGGVGNKISKLMMFDFWQVVLCCGWQQQQQ